MIFKILYSQNLIISKKKKPYKNTFRYANLLKGETIVRITESSRVLGQEVIYFIFVLKLEADNYFLTSTFILLSFRLHFVSFDMLKILYFCLDVYVIDILYVY